MQITGIVRRIDELGRIVIPKEIRTNLRIHDGENMEIMIDNEENIILKKHMIMSKIANYAQNFTDAIYGFIKKNIIITDVDKIIAASGDLKKELLNQELSDNMLESIKRRECIFEHHTKDLCIIKEKCLECTYIINTIIVNGDAVGLIIILSAEEKVNDIDVKIIKIVSSFLEKQLII
ncbi:MAG: stage V sporulation T C-terminal domain-containing protein [Bacilli bacterium]